MTTTTAAAAGDTIRLHTALITDDHVMHLDHDVDLRALLTRLSAAMDTALGDEHTDATDTAGMLSLAENLPPQLDDAAADENAVRAAFTDWHLALFAVIPDPPLIAVCDATVRIRAAAASPQAAA